MAGVWAVEEELDRPLLSLRIWQRLTIRSNAGRVNAGRKPLALRSVTSPHSSPTGNRFTRSPRRWHIGSPVIVGDRPTFHRQP
jgi:hypothetical protein